MFVRSLVIRWGFFITAAAMVTLAFALIERFGGPIDQLYRWTPEHLPAPLAPRKGLVGIGVRSRYGNRFPASAGRRDPSADRRGYRLRFRVEPAAIRRPVSADPFARLGAARGEPAQMPLPYLRRTVSLLTIAVCVAAGRAHRRALSGRRLVTVVPTGKGPVDVTQLTESLNLSIRITAVVLAIAMMLRWRWASLEARPWPEDRLKPDSFLLVGTAMHLCFTEGALPAGSPRLRVSDGC